MFLGGNKFVNPYVERDKKNLKLAVFGVQVAAYLIEIALSTGDRIQESENRRHPRLRHLRAGRQALRYEGLRFASACTLLQHIEFVREQKEVITGRGITFKREKRSIFQKRRQLAAKGK